jgi:hypothetical protein
MAVSELSGFKKSQTNENGGKRSCKQSGTVNDCNVERPGKNSGKFSRSRFKNEKITVFITRGLYKMKYSKSIIR